MGQEGYKAGRTNVGVNQATGQFHVEINGLATPESYRGRPHLPGRS